MSKSFSENAIQFIIAMIISWLIMYLFPVKLFFQVYIPGSFVWLFLLVSFAVIARGWPMVPPEGLWKPGMSKLGMGLLETVLTIVLAILGALFVLHIWPVVPLFPVALYFGALLFGTTLWYAFTWRCYPVADKSGAVNLLVGVIVIVVLDVMIWSTLINFAGTPWENAPFNPKGVFQCDFMLGLAIWFIAWIFIFGNSLQGYPFYKIPAPFSQIIQTAVIAVLGYLSWTISLKFLSPSFSFAALGGSIIAWSFYHTAFFEFFPNIKYLQPQRGINNLIVVAVMTAFWIPFCRLILGPILTKASAAGISFDISTLTIFYSLHVIAVILTIHSFFLFKIPFAPPGRPIGPEEIPQEDQTGYKSSEVKEGL